MDNCTYNSSEAYGQGSYDDATCVAGVTTTTPGGETLAETGQNLWLIGGSSIVVGVVLIVAAVMTTLNKKKLQPITVTKE